MRLDARYPIGVFTFNGEMTKEEVGDWIDQIEQLPFLLKEAVANLNNDQLNTPYRLQGWTVAQVVHHLADSHMNAFVRFKLALTEEKPVIKPYNEAKWAELPDYDVSIDVSLTLLEAIHVRWVKLLRSLGSTDLKRTFFHPESGEVSIGQNIGIYAWHGRHHLAHITTLCDRLGWS
jgi:uncharacterized damage-inducible protein DinB